MFIPTTTVIREMSQCQVLKGSIMQHWLLLSCADDFVFLKKTPFNFTRVYCIIALVESSQEDTQWPLV